MSYLYPNEGREEPMQPPEFISCEHGVALDDECEECFLSLPFEENDDEQSL